MASKYDWDFIRPLDQSANILAMGQGNQQINAGLQDMGNAVTGYADAIKQRNTDEILNTLYGAQNSADLPQAMQAVQALQQQYGRGYDQSQVRNAIDTRGSTLGQRDLQNINLQQAQAAQAAIPQLNQANAAEAIRQGANPEQVNALAALGIDASSTLNRFGTNAQSDSRDVRDYADKRADVAYNRQYQQGRDAVSDAQWAEGNERAKTDAAFRYSEVFEKPASSGWVTDANGDQYYSNNPGVSRGDAFTALAIAITGHESGNVSNAKNPNSSATGTGQFINSTWLSMMKNHRPELTKGKSEKEILAMRNDPKLAGEMTAQYAKNNAKGLESAGLQATDGNVYLAHFAGLGGAKALLKANPNASAESILGKDAADKNGKLIRGKTAGEVIQWAQNSMQKRMGNQATQALGPVVSQANMSKVTADYKNGLAKLEGDFASTGINNQTKGSLATTGKSVDTWAASNRGKDSTFFTNAGDLAKMAKADHNFNKLPENAQINVLNGAFSKMNDVNFMQYVPGGDLKKFISRESQNYQKDRLAKHTQDKKNLEEQAYQSIVQQYQAVGAQPPNIASVMQMLNPQSAPAPTKAKEATKAVAPTPAKQVATPAPAKKEVVNTPPKKQTEDERILNTPAVNLNASERARRIELKAQKTKSLTEAERNKETLKAVAKENTTLKLQADVAKRDADRKVREREEANQRAKAKLAKEQADKQKKEVNRAPTNDMFKGLGSTGSKTLTQAELNEVLKKYKQG